MPGGALRPTAAGRALLDTFAITRVVNLVERTDRRREIEAEFARLGLVFDGDRIAFFPAVQVVDRGGFPTPGTRGCFQSHVGVIEQARALGAASVLLLEDDVDWSQTIERDLPLALSALAAAPWSIFYGGFLDRDGTPPAASDAPATLETVPPAVSVLGGHCVAFAGPAIARAPDYLRAMAERAPGSSEGGPMHVDGAYGWFRRANPDLRTRLAVPPLCHQRSSRTDIHALGLKDRLPGLAQATRLARRVARWRRQRGA